MKRTVLWVALGSLLGSLSRHALHQGLPEQIAGLPLGTLTVNAIGSLLIGWFAALSLPRHHPLAALHFRQFVMTGFCGGFTTFSLFSLETLVLIETGAWGAAWLNMVVTIIVVLLAVSGGFLIGRRSG